MLLCLLLDCEWYLVNDSENWMAHQLNHCFPSPSSESQKYVYCCKLLSRCLCLRFFPSLFLPPLSPPKSQQRLRKSQNPVARRSHYTLEAVSSQSAWHGKQEAERDSLSTRYSVESTDRKRHQLYWVARIPTKQSNRSSSLLRQHSHTCERWQLCWLIVREQHKSSQMQSDMQKVTLCLYILIKSLLLLFEPPCSLRGRIRNPKIPTLGFVPS